MTDADEIMNPQHFGTDIPIRIWINPAMRINPRSLLFVILSLAEVVLCETHSYVSWCESWKCTDGLQLGMLMITSLRQMFVAAGTLLCFSDRLSVWQQVQDRGEPRSCRQLGVDGGSWWACCKDVDHHWDLRQRRCNYLTVSLSNLSLEVCRKPKLFRFSFENPNCPKIWHLSVSFPTKTGCNL